jgi:hypothetical protein
MLESEAIVGAAYTMQWVALIKVLKMGGKEEVRWERKKGKVWVRTGLTKYSGTNLSTLWRDRPEI